MKPGLLGHPALESKYTLAAKRQSGKVIFRPGVATGTPRVFSAPVSLATGTITLPFRGVTVKWDIMSRLTILPPEFNPKIESPDVARRRVLLPPPPPPPRAA